ncbi:hypothetical protein EWM64_g926 [Hericium alpestre]|uniref:Cytochrome P450 n=1 Tax=Hericium alpestre TaxID=135208 RepID=A0A4Z0A9V0_9AGAM|nr:hypothetical protein EWM64_g926 [Hericium alpestre]
MLVGPSKCRNEDYIRINVKFASRVVTLGHILSYVPVPFRPFVAHLIYPPSDKRHLYNHLKPMIDERRTSLDSGSDTTVESDDYLKWLVEATRNKPDDMDIVLRNMHMNFASIHTTGLICTHMFYSIACNQAWQTEIRDEARHAMKEHGWTKKALEEMVKADSFIKEVLRFHGVSSVALTRMAVKPFTFADSTTVPAGTMFCAASRAIHFDSAKWVQPEDFDPFRFCHAARTELNGMVTTSYDFLAWGHGRYACPGRFFASYELKAILAYALVNYEIFLQGGGACPKIHWFVAACMPDSSATLGFRRRPGGAT